jgi:ketosteroid isomerase-like protein
MSVRVSGVLLVYFLIASCSNNTDTERNKKMAGEFLDLALSDNPKSAQVLTHPDFTFTFMGVTEISNIPYDRDAYFDDWIPNVVGGLLPNGITLTTTDMIADARGVAVIMEGDAEGINGEYNNKYVFVYKFKDGLIHTVTEYNSDLLVATRLYKQKLIKIKAPADAESVD